MDIHGSTAFSCFFRKTRELPWIAYKCKCCLHGLASVFCNHIDHIEVWELGVDWVPDIEAQSAPKVTNTCSLQALQRKEMPQSDPAHLEGLEKGDQGICKWPNSSGCCFKCDHVEFQCDAMCSVPACHACDTLLPLCQPTLGPGVDLRRRMGIIMFIINSICMCIYIHKQRAQERSGAQGQETTLRGCRKRIANEHEWTDYLGPSGFVWKCLTPSSNEFQWIVIFATNVAATKFGALLGCWRSTGCDGQVLRGLKCPLAVSRAMGCPWDAIENMIYQKLIMVYDSLWQLCSIKFLIYVTSFLYPDFWEP